MAILYADGGVIGKNPSPVGGTWAWVLVDDSDEEVLAQDSGVVDAINLKGAATNNQMELYALIRGLSDCVNEGILEVRSDSRVSLGRIFDGWGMSNILGWMRVDFANMIALYPHKPWTQILELKHTLLDGHPTKAQLKAGIGKRGHPVSKWNVLCDTLCKQEAQRYMEASK